MMDVYVGDQNGCDLCKLVKHQADTIDTRVILMSGDENCSTLADYAGADDFMTKPFDYNDLLERVQRQVEHSHVGAVKGQLKETVEQVNKEQRIRH